MVLMVKTPCFIQGELGSIPNTRFGGKWRQELEEALSDELTAIILAF